MSEERAAYGSDKVAERDWYPAGSMFRITIPVTLYGLGTREAVLIALLSVFGASAEVVVALSLFWFVGIWLVPSVVGAVVSLVGGWSNVDEVKNL